MLSGRVSRLEVPMQAATRIVPRRCKTQVPSAPTPITWRQIHPALPPPAFAVPCWADGWPGETPSDPGEPFKGRRVAVFQGFADQAARRLALLDSAEVLGDLVALPGHRLESLRGDRAGQDDDENNLSMLWDPRSAGLAITASRQTRPATCRRP